MYTQGNEQTLIVSVSEDRQKARKYLDKVMGCFGQDLFGPRVVLAYFWELFPPDFFTLRLVTEGEINVCVCWAS